MKNIFKTKISNVAFNVWEHFAWNFIELALSTT